ncbi:crossover junction endodeoxyribonuclease RuvC [Methylococcus sp. EFPC2]|uniref:crossover junction endodeoxyribonuclease RuvC n=1 Tax=Methylococcus sp. EFPC2 TaxID=2812648 RepID=UPI001967B20B|nr:crossover junction endodeoxyribonuclease RuvC [Methylococcus sp. EFPC2]QSA95803.1 crossover junction endodeoxyribonuclease RuvC [Methylococcus sp. EFPC2]
MTRVLGIDPGSRCTGYGLVDTGTGSPRLVAQGCIRTETETFPERLRQIYDGIHAIARQYRPDELAIEQVFVHKNADSALKLGQARGAAICGVLAAGLPVYEYAAREVKLALVGKGSADKIQVQHMVKILLGLSENLQADAGDALGIALCHIHTRETQRRMESMQGRRLGVR